ncbi:MAG TPA: hypothetical protein VKV04_05505 [Verrucomicrobiae bacterium]|nr:hypothetical protein [Verrucomicrobiae bacterium]
MTGLKLLKALMVITVVVALILPLIMHPPKYPEVRRVNNQQQIGLGFRIYEGDGYPLAVSHTNGGSTELNKGSNAFRTFQVVSN